MMDLIKKEKNTINLVNSILNSKPENLFSVFLSGREAFLAEKEISSDTRQSLNVDDWDYENERDNDLAFNS